MAVATACVAESPTPPPDPTVTATHMPTSPAATAGADPSPEAESTAPAVAVGIDVPEPSRHFDGVDILDAMHTSRRPGGVPQELQTEPIASAVAQSIWTFDASDPWWELVAGGSCGPETCSLEVSGAPDGAVGEDLYVFEVTRASGAVELVASNLRGFPQSLMSRLDELARSLLDAASFEGLALVSARWLPPPDEGQFVLSYRSGGEEGSCGMDLTIHAPSAHITADASYDC